MKIWDVLLIFEMRASSCCVAYVVLEFEIAQFEFKFEFELGILEVAVSDCIQILLQSFTATFTPHFQFNASYCLNWILLNPKKAFKRIKSSAWPSPRTVCAFGCLIIGNLKVQTFLLTVMKDWCMWCFEAERLFLFLRTKWCKILEVWKSVSIEMSWRLIYLIWICQ